MGPVEARYAANVSGLARLGVVVGRRAAPLATRRNRLKRLMRESFRTAAQNLPAVDVVVRAVRPPASEAEVREALRQIWQRLGCDVTHDDR